MMRRLMLILLAVGLSGWAAEAMAARPASPPGALISWNGLHIKAEKSAVLVAPGSSQVLVFVGEDPTDEVKVLECKGQGCQARSGGVTFRAPTVSGNYWFQVKLEIRRRSSGAAGPAVVKWVQIAELVGFPSSLLDHGFLNGFELGEYPDLTQMSHPDYYKPPAFFYYLDYSVMGCWISEHIHLGDLGYDGRAPLPQYFALNLELPKKLEAMSAELKRRGLSSRIHFIGGGFISPKSNRIRTSQNSAAAELSRHLFGEAVDFIIDENPRDEIIDDMNHDGLIDVRDCFVIRDVVTALEQSGRVRAGGFGIYSPPRNSQIMMHIDVRGYPSRWGYKVWDPATMSNLPPNKPLRPGG